jgi:hypothetical protein
MISRIRIIHIFIVISIILPHISMATPPGLTTILGVTIHLKNNEKLNGYIEANVYMNACNEKSEDYEKVNRYIQTFKDYLAKQGDIHSLSDGRDTVRFINKLIDMQYGKVSRPVTTESNIKLVKMDDIRSIESVCRKWDGKKTMSGIPIITDYMAKYISKHKLIAFYEYDVGAILEKEGEAPEECVGAGLCAWITTYLSYNPKYTREKLIKLRKKNR